MKLIKKNQVINQNYQNVEIGQADPDLEIDSVLQELPELCIRAKPKRNPILNNATYPRESRNMKADNLQKLKLL